MNFKIDTKEKFYVLEPEMEHLSANMADELCTKLLSLSQNEPFNVILKLPSVKTIEAAAATKLAACRQMIYEQRHSFVVCNLTDDALEQITALELEDAINLTPTESEAWDIVQMDEIEREFDEEV
jgi:anti-anti-sigma regulatory factor